jgi:hypothetical protein
VNQIPKKVEKWLPPGDEGAESPEMNPTQKAIFPEAHSVKKQFLSTYRG